MDIFAHVTNFLLVFLGVCTPLYALVSYLRLLDGPKEKGKRHEWKKDEDPALPEDSSPLFVAIDKGEEERKRVGGGREGKRPSSTRLPFPLGTCPTANPFTPL